MEEEKELQEDIMGLLDNAISDPIESNDFSEIVKDGKPGEPPKEIVVKIPSVEAIPPVEEPEIQPVIKKEPPKSDLTIPEDNDEDDLGMRALVGKFGIAVESIIENQSADRAQIDEAIKFFEKEVRKARENKQKISPSMVEAWAKLLQTKTEVNSNASKVLDSVTRLISAGKGNELIIKPGDVGNSSNMNIAELLSQDDDDD
jgi:hypothetical protein